MTPWENPQTLVDVVVVEDHAEFRESLRFILENTGHIRCKVYAAAEEALGPILMNTPDVIIMDIRLPGMDGIELTKQLIQKRPDVLVLICTVHEDDELIFQALRAGAKGYLLKRSSVEDLVEAIRQVLAGGSPMSPAIARRVVNSFRPQLPKDLNVLTDREQSVLDLISTGMTAKEISERLFVSVNTVRTHIRHIYEKLQVQSRVQAARKAGKR
jgi:DNA-binding NarL/FixJ family response regulator